MVDLARLAACLFSLHAVCCDAAAMASPIEFGQFHATDRDATVPVRPSPISENVEAAWRCGAPASPGPMQKNGSGSASGLARSKPIGTIDHSSEGNLQRADGSRSPHISWARAKSSSLHLRHVLLQI